LLHPFNPSLFPRPRHQIVCRVSSEIATASLLASALSPDRVHRAVSVLHQQPSTFRFSTFGLFGERSNSRQALRNLPIHYREQVAERASSQLRIGICARAQSSQQLVPDLISLPCFASPTTRSFSYPRSPTQLALIIKALTTSSCFFNVIELLLSLVSRFTPIPIPHSRLPHPHYHLNPQPPCTPDSTSTLILSSTATQRHHGSPRRRPPFRQPQLHPL
jgi:hypothetical protein